jgi:hypothetical protein
MVNDDIWIPTPDELDAEAQAERERHGGRRRTASVPRSEGGSVRSASTGQRRTLRVGGDVTRRGRGEDAEEEESR